jgi:cytochrome c
VHRTKFAAAALVLLAASPALADGDPVKGARTFHGYCGACHQIGPGAATLVGPELNGVVGRKAGTVAGYPYSDAMRNSGVTWDEPTLTTYLHGPQKMIPGVRMTFAGFSRDQDIANVIAYLKTIGKDGNPVAPAQ